MAQVPKPTTVFISYARSDMALHPRWLDVIIKSLIANGLLTNEDRILKEEDLSPMHGDLRREMKRLIQSASKVIVVWGPHSATSQWVNYEVGLADALGKPIIVVLPTSEEVALPASLQNVQVIRVASDG